MQRIFLRTAPLLLALGLAACAAKPPAQYVLDVPSSSLRLSPLVSAIEVRTVSLPRYATADGITLQQPDQTLITVTDEVWADSPERAATLAIARNLGEITRARVAAEPWPYADPAGAMVSVTVEQFFPTSDGQVRLSGSYAIAPLASSLSDRGGRFDISAPIADAAPNALAEAYGQALLDLSQTIARRIAR